jgi:hypothetical protein
MAAEMGGYGGVDNRILLNALIYRREHNCKWRSRPKGFGNRQKIYVRLNRRHTLVCRITFLWHWEGKDCLHPVRYALVV